ncbi:Uncharacterized protein pbN1_39750 [Aromatoleum bremense]|nr:Uncharacterized protein pbN1_39750 [Aromatoleum bremense]
MTARQGDAHSAAAAIVPAKLRRTGKYQRTLSDFAMRTPHMAYSNIKIFSRIDGKIT